MILYEKKTKIQKETQKDMEEFRYFPWEGDLLRNNQEELKIYTERKSTAAKKQLLKRSVP